MRCLGVVLCLCASQALAQDKQPGSDKSQTPGQSPQPGQPSSPFAYTTRIKGDFSPAILELLKRSSQLIALKDKAPASRAGLQRRIDDDVERFQKVLRSEGYYDGQVRATLDDSGDMLAIAVEGESGPLYGISAFAITYASGRPAGAPQSGGDLGIESGQPARAQDLKQAEAALLNRLANGGYPHANLIETRYELNRAAKSLAATLSVDPGPPRAFGPLLIAGLERTNEAYLRRLIAWPHGESYDASRLDQLRRELSGLGIFDSVLFQPAEEATAQGQLPVTLRVVESEHRSIGFSAGVSTDELFELEAFWEHRNLFGEGEQLRLSSSTTTVRQQAKLGFRNPNFPKRDRTLIVDSSVQREDSDAFEELGTSHFIGEERALAPNLTLLVGPSFEVSRIDDEGDEETYGLIGLPVSLSYDGRDDRLNPTEGWRLLASTTPYLGVLFEPTQFWSNRLDGAGYLAVDEDKRVVLAARGAVGIIAGDSRDDVPANKRFYAGGAGSVRGYEFRSVSPLDEDDDPIGGRSLVEINLEARIGITDTIGVVPFIDGGQVFAGQLFDKGDRFLWAGGLGLRYFSPIGPLRLDVAVPINRRSDVDDAFEVYISIGQAF